MGDQPFGTGTILIDMRRMNRVLNFDAGKGEIAVEAGIRWPELVAYLLEAQSGRERPGRPSSPGKGWATRRQLESCYPQFPEFLRLKKKYDPEERFQSEWYRHYKAMFA